jgi:hypothetical protein
MNVRLEANSANLIALELWKLPTRPDRYQQSTVSDLIINFALNMSALTREATYGIKKKKRSSTIHLNYKYVSLAALVLW